MSTLSTGPGDRMRVSRTLKKEEAMRAGIEGHPYSDEHTLPRCQCTAHRAKCNHPWNSSIGKPGQVDLIAGSGDDTGKADKDGCLLAIQMADQAHGCWPQIQDWRSCCNGRNGSGRDRGLWG